jgi:hypothetical protein
MRRYKDDTNRSFAKRGNSEQLATQQRKTVWAATYDLLRSLRLTTFFGKPGSTELPLLENFPSDFQYILGLQESTAVAMADGFAQATRRPALVNLHTAAGIGNGTCNYNIMTAFLNKTPLITREIPRLCRGGSKSLTIPAIPPQAPADETLNASGEVHERIRSMTCEAPEPTIDDAEHHEGVIPRGIVNLRWTRGKTGLTRVDGRLQAAHLSGPRSDPDAALSGSYLKAPGSAGG